MNYADRYEAVGVTPAEPGTNAYTVYIENDTDEAAAPSDIVEVSPVVSWLHCLDRDDDCFVAHAMLLNGDIAEDLRSMVTTTRDGEGSYLVGVYPPGKEPSAVEIRRTMACAFRSLKRKAAA